MAGHENDGVLLERIISVIESVLVPKGFKVENRKTIYEGGVQMAELDIVITGRVRRRPTLPGSSSVGTGHRKGQHRLGGYSNSWDGANCFDWTR